MARVGPGGAVYQPQQTPWSARTYTPTTSPNYTGGPTYDPGPQPANSGPRTGTNTATPTKANPTTSSTPSPSSPWAPTSTPGYGENWYAANAYKWNQPSQAANYWQGVQGQFNGPTQYETNLAGYGNQLGGTQGQATSLYDQYNQSGQFTTPGQNEQWYAQNGGQYNAPSAGEQTLGNLVGQYGQTGAMTNWANQNGQFFTAPGAAESFYQNAIPGLMANNSLAQHAGGISDYVRSADNMQGLFGSTVGQLGMPGYTENLADQYAPQSSYAEQFLTGGGAGEGLDSLYNRLYETGARQLDQRAAAGGSFNSGAALRANEELGKDLAAQHVKDYMAATQAADAGHLGQQTYGLNLMQGADQGLNNRLSTAYKGATAADASTLSQATALQGLYSGVSDEARANVGLGGNLANDAQAGAIGRMSEGANVANMANTDWLDQLAGMGTAANSEANQWLNRLNGGQNAAASAQNSENQRVNTGMGAANTAQGDWLSQILGAGNLTNDAQQSMWNRLLNGNTLASSADTGSMAWLAGGQDAANSAQNMQQNRENNTFNNLNTLGSEQANTNQQATSAARDEQRSLLMDQINGMLRSGQMTADQIQAIYGNQMATLGLIIQGGEAIASGGTSLAVPRGATGAGGTSATGSRGGIPGLGF